MHGVVEAAFRSEKWFRIRAPTHDSFKLQPESIAWWRSTTERGRQTTAPELREGAFKFYVRNWDGVERDARGANHKQLREEGPTD